MEKLVILLLLGICIYLYYTITLSRDTNNINKSGVKQIEHSTSLPTKSIIKQSILDAEPSIDTNQIEIDLDDLIMKEDEDVTNTLTENTKDLINNSVKTLLEDIFKQILLVFNINHKNKLYDTNIKIMLQDNEITANFLDLLRSYIGTVAFGFDENTCTLLCGDYIGNNGTVNLNAGREMIAVKESPPNFIAANTISMITEEQNGKYYIGSQFALNFYDIKDKEFIKKHNLIPFGTFETKQDSDKLLLAFYKNEFNNLHVNKPRVKSIDDCNKSTLLSYGE